MTVSIPKNLLPHLNEIATRLWSGHAAIMVGAGFSKNATPKNDSCKGFPNWNELGELFYEKTRGEKIGDSNVKFLNVLKLADEVQASLGRPMLHQLLRESIPDEEYEPSELHVKLLELPWVDVLTTNYDTLIERARKSVTENKFDVVVKKEDLIYSEKPRIIKLHGSFPSIEPFIITEEDYRQYPDKFAPFVNTVQQTLLENTLCLIGFSGDDPNFLRWIGWIRDNLGTRQSPKIYLIGVLNLSQAQQSLLAQYNIVPIDMSEVSNVNNHYIGIDTFFNFCLSKKEEGSRLDWPSTKNLTSPDLNNKDKQAQIRELIPKWKKQRVSFPGWVVVPDDRRSALWSSTNYWDGYIKATDELSNIELLEFMHELLWRLEKSLCPIFDHNIPLIISVLEHYLPPFVEKKDANSFELEDELRLSNIDKRDVKSACSFILLSLMRYYREEGALEKWKECERQAVAFLTNQNDLAKLSYEKALCYLFELNYSAATEELTSWKIPESMPFWSAKKAGLLAEIGKLDEALKILEWSLKSVRATLNLMPITTDYSSVSQESYILVLLKYIKNGQAWNAGKYSSLYDFSERWNVLKQYKCDPWNELKLLELPLTVKPIKQTSENITNAFDVGRTVRSMHMGGSNADELAAFNILKFIEDSGVPYKIPGSTFAKKGIEGAINRIAEYVPYWVVATMLRMGDSKVVDLVYNRKSLSKISIFEVDSLIQNYIKVFYKVILSEKTNSYQAKLLKKILPEVLSRLSCKCSSEMKKTLIDLLFNIYSFQQKNDFEGVSNLANRLIGSISEFEVLEYIPKLLNFPILGDQPFLLEREFKNPFNYLYNLDVTLVQINESFSLDSSQIKTLIVHAESSEKGLRVWAVRTLMELNRLNLLLPEQLELFINALWNKVEPPGFPIDTNYYKFAFINSLSPINIDAKQLLKKHILSSVLPIQKNELSDGVSLGGGDYPIFNETQASSSIAWSQKEFYEIFYKYFDWWNIDKIYLENQNSSDVEIEFRARFSNISNVLVEIISNKISTDNFEGCEELIGLINDMKNHGLPVCYLTCAFINIIPDGIDKAIESIEYSVTHTESEFIVDGFKGLFLVLSLGKGNIDDSVVNFALSILSNSLLFRSRKIIINALNTVSRIITKNEPVFFGELEKRVIDSLDKLVNETTSGAGVFEFSDALFIRETSARLAYKLYRLYSSKQAKVPTSLMKWKSVCNSNDEFVEVRNSWDSE